MPDFVFGMWRQWDRRVVMQAGPRKLVRSYITARHTTLESEIPRQRNPFYGFITYTGAY